MAPQALIYAAHVVPLAVVWLATVLEWVPVLKHTPESLQPLVIMAPIIAVFMLGFYAIFSVVYGVATFNDCAAARQELIKEIAEAREDLKKKKII